MPWTPATYYAATCDRCGVELEYVDEGTTVLFAAEQKTDLHRFDWHQVKLAGLEQLICDNCWDRIDPASDDPAAAAKDAFESQRWDQTGPTLVGGES